MSLNVPQGVCLARLDRQPLGQFAYRLFAVHDPHSVAKPGHGPIDAKVAVAASAGEKIKSVKDGTSNTLLIGEATNLDRSDRRPVWAYGMQFYNKADITLESRILSNSWEKCQLGGGDPIGNPDEPFEGNGPCERMYGSLHTGGLNFIMADGSLRFFPYEMDILLLGNLATMDGREPITEE